MTANEIRQKFIDFFKSQPRNHKEIPSSSLVPENDPTSLFTSSGMQPLIAYLLGEKHPLGTRLVDSQKCFRSQDIEEIGDNRHTTFFEMLGNWSLGDYFKKEQLPWIFEFLTGELGLDPKRLYVTVFEGNKSVSKDTESIKIWKEIFAGGGIDAEEGKRIFPYPATKNWWSRSGEPENMPAGEPGGPDSEVFFDFGENLKLHEKSPFNKQKCHPNCDCGRFMEIANSVFMQYQKQSDGNLMELPKKNVDFGGGLERMVAVTNNNPDVFQTDLFLPIINILENFSNKKYNVNQEETKAMRIIADHIRASVMIMGDGVRPSNKLQGAVLRRLITKIISNANTILEIKNKIIKEIAVIVIDIYKNSYPSVFENKDEILFVLDEEEIRLRRSIDQGTKVLQNVYIPQLQTDKKADVLLKNNLDQYKIDYGQFRQTLGGFTSLASVASGTVAFITQTSYGLPTEYSKPLLEPYIKNLDEYNRSFEGINIIHKDLSRTSSKGMFKGGLQDQSEATTKLHTATHLLQQALRTVLGDHVRQKGSHITAERLRFDFSHPTKVTSQEIQKIEVIVNKKIEENLAVSMKIIDLKEAIGDGALTVPGVSYPQKVKVYSIGYFSKEVCGGPHVDFTGSLGTFKIIKEDAAASNVRRIYAILTK